MKTAHITAGDVAWTTADVERMDGVEASERIPLLECLRLLENARLGRIVFTDNAVPAVEPVDFRLDRDAAVFLIASDSRLGIALGNSVVALEVDHIDQGDHGWYVAAVGQARIVEEPNEIARLSRLGIQRRSPDAVTFVRVPLTTIEGRYLSLTAPAGPFVAV
ncbi:pyridoxamine 5'-phosphate oxidase family protein [Actinopolymorpha alba]|uniref:pyridoxamine 5'-phosphate oxidase family protein n=1 Tax=Actinopolymorpha alba TaxID=533267 RepID=UPI00037CA447|nr:pyridoxamine 5'-phosphate oxidase family protein [Actinopolymorpha alba]